MAYQNVGTPRFYVDILQWLKSQGQLSQDSYTSQFLTDGDFMDLVGINPTNQLTFPDGDGNNDLLRFKSALDFDKIMPNEKNFSMVLGHNFGSANSSYKTSIIDSNDVYYTVSSSELINNTSGTTSGTIALDGFSILTGNDAQEAENCNRMQFRFDYQGTGGTYNNNPLKIGSLLYGTYYDMPHSPDLSLKLSYDYDGIKTQQTKGGATLSNALYSKPADWGILNTGVYADNPRTLGCWQLEHPNDTHVTAPNYRTGRRVWDLSFSYLSDREVFPANASNNQYYSDIYDNSQMQNVFGYHEDDITAQGQFNSNILTGTDFFSQVWNKTMGGHLPFIFQPNKDVKLADQFAICRFDMDSLQYDLVAHNTYNVKIKIRESW
tara:strand:+ start:6314 stop:7450 length:1137 start_codon:yes stop_codon:yes gene_type:complete